MKKTIFFILSSILFLANACKEDTWDDIDEASYQYLPENRMAVDSFSGYTARYIEPTQRYKHGILGDEIEAGGLLVVVKNVHYTYRLDSNLVFEDIQPRLKDIDNDGTPEIVTILSDINKGACVAAFKVHKNELILFAQGEFIGQSNRWLNIAAIDDLDENGKVEIAWVSTPHIGGVLKIGQLIGNEIVVLYSQGGVSNHKIGSRNQDLSLIIENEKYHNLYLPNNAYDAVIGFQWKENRIIPVDTIVFQVQVQIPLSDQFRNQ